MPLIIPSHILVMFPTEDDDEALLQWLQVQLDVKKLGKGVVAGNLPLSHCVRYRIKKGLNVKINKAYGMPGGNTINLLIIVRGKFRG